MQGLPASGKSTKAEELLIQHGNTVRINKDLLRTMLHFDNFNGKNEGMTQDASKMLTRHFLSNNVNVIIDDTNFNPKVIESLVSIAKETDSKIEYVKMDTPLLECIMRDKKRVNSVGGIVIKNMALQYGLVPKPIKGYVLCDIDGTIADISHRLRFVKPKKNLKSKPGEPDVYEDDPRFKKDWKSFFSGIPSDIVREDTRKILIDYYNQGYDVIFITARPDDYKEATIEWLHKHMLTFAFTIIMRRAGDTRKDTEVKKDMLDKYFPDKSLIYRVIDDRPSVIRMWKEQGLEVIDVGYGNEF